MVLRFGGTNHINHHTHLTCAKSLNPSNQPTYTEQRWVQIRLRGVLLLFRYAPRTYCTSEWSSQPVVKVRWCSSFVSMDVCVPVLFVVRRRARRMSSQVVAAAIRGVWSSWAALGSSRRSTEPRRALAGASMRRSAIWSIQLLDMWGGRLKDDDGDSLDKWQSSHTEPCSYIICLCTYTLTHQPTPIQPTRSLARDHQSPQCDGKVAFPIVAQIYLWRRWSPSEHPR
jgi:hypothetical protein